MKRKRIAFIIKGKEAKLARFLSQLKNTNITMRNVHIEQHTVYFEASTAAIPYVRRYRRPYRCKVKVREIEGESFNPLYSFKFLILLLLPYLLSFFIWQVEIDTSMAEVEKELEEKLKTAKVVPFTLKSMVMAEDELRRYLMDQKLHLSWIRFEQSGVKLKVIPMEAPKLANEPTDKAKPADLVAKTGGIITNFALTQGERVEKLHATVKKGDLLATGRLIQGDREVIVGAEGAVYANYWLEYQFTLPRKIHFFVQGEEKIHYRLRKPKFGYDLLKKENWNIIEVERTSEEKEITEVLNKGMETTWIVPMVKKQVMSELGYQAMIQSEKLLHVTFDNDKVKGTILFLVNDNIAEKRLIEQGD